MMKLLSFYNDRPLTMVLITMLFAFVTACDSEESDTQSNDAIVLDKENPYLCDNVETSFSGGDSVDGDPATTIAKKIRATMCQNSRAMVQIKATNDAGIAINAVGFIVADGKELVARSHSSQATNDGNDADTNNELAAALAVDAIDADSIYILTSFFVAADGNGRDWILDQYQRYSGESTEAFRSGYEDLNPKEIAHPLTLDHIHRAGTVTDGAATLVGRGRMRIKGVEDLIDLVAIPYLDAYLASGPLDPSTGNSRVNQETEASNDAQQTPTEEEAAKIGRFLAEPTRKQNPDNADNEMLLLYAMIKVKRPSHFNRPESSSTATTVALDTQTITNARIDRGFYGFYDEFYTHFISPDADLKNDLRIFEEGHITAEGYQPNILLATNNIFYLGLNWSAQPPATVNFVNGRLSGFNFFTQRNPETAEGDESFENQFQIDAAALLEQFEAGSTGGIGDKVFANQALNHPHTTFTAEIAIANKAATKTYPEGDARSITCGDARTVSENGQERDQSESYPYFVLDENNADGYIKIKLSTTVFPSDLLNSNGFDKASFVTADGDPAAVSIYVNHVDANHRININPEIRHEEGFEYLYINRATLESKTIQQTGETTTERTLSSLNVPAKIIVYATAIPMSQDGNYDVDPVSLLPKHLSNTAIITFCVVIMAHQLEGSQAKSLAEKRTQIRNQNTHQQSNGTAQTALTDTALDQRATQALANARIRNPQNSISTSTAQKPLDTRLPEPKVRTQADVDRERYNREILIQNTQALTAKKAEDKSTSASSCRVHKHAPNFGNTFLLPMLALLTASLFWRKRNAMRVDTKGDKRG